MDKFFDPMSFKDSNVRVERSALSTVIKVYTTGYLFLRALLTSVYGNLTSFLCGRISGVYYFFWHKNFADTIRMFIFFFQRGVYPEYFSKLYSRGRLRVQSPVSLYLSLSPARLAKSDYPVIVQSVYTFVRATLLPLAIFFIFTTYAFVIFHLPFLKILSF